MMQEEPRVGLLLQLGSALSLGLLASNFLDSRLRYAADSLSPLLHMGSTRTLRGWSCP